ncbi:PepSY domain-containing protein [Paraburkholderia strydomiana]|uniref:PepSY domain-containing protein n=1 Tax=Paraburkholderia strydomiana TaxID=1245417 RepID=UPI0038B79486
MKRPALRRSIAIVSLVALCAGVAQLAQADDDCSAPLTNWKPVSEIDALARKQGWNVSRVRTDDGCYEIRGLDAQGRHFKAKVDPATLAIIRLKTDGDARDERHGEDDGEHEDRSGPRPGAAGPRAANDKPGNAASGAQPPNGLLTPGSRPQVQIR